MNSRNVLQAMIGLATVTFLLVGCGPKETAPAATPVAEASIATSTLIPPTSTPTPVPPTLTPTTPPTNTPTPTPTPVPPRIAFASDRDGEFDIYVMNADGSDLTRLTDDPAWDGLPAWSSDGRRIAFISNRDDNTNIYVMNADGSDLTRLTDNPADDEFPAWSPDGQQIAFKSVDDQGNYDIYVMNADGSDLTRLAEGLDYDEFGHMWPLVPPQVPLWSPDGEQLVVMSGHDEGIFDIYAVNADGSGLTRLTYDMHRAFSPVWSPR
jgi:TolB protein